MPTVTTLSGFTVSIDLGTRDFEGFRFDALELADSIAVDWNDRSEADPGVTLTELMAFMMDNLSYYQDRCANEAFFPSAVQRRSIIKHTQHIGYTLSPNTSASVELTFVTNASGTIPANERITVDTSDGSDPNTFELESDFVSTGAGTYTGVIALNGITTSETIGSSNGTADQKFPLTDSPLTRNPDGSWSLKVYVAEGGPAVLWERVDNFNLSEPLDKHYRVDIDENDYADVVFGDGVNGKIPASGTNNITSTYRTGGGLSGNSVGVDKLTQLNGSYPFIDSVTNPEQPTGGQDKESNEEAKENAPLSIAANDRGVSHPDYVALAKEVPGVSQAVAQNGDGVYIEEVIISSTGSNPVPTGDWDPYLETGSGIIGNVGLYINERKSTPVILYVLPCQVFEIIIDFTVYLFNNYSRSDVQRAIEDAVTEAFDVNNLRLGQQVPVSLLCDTVEDVAGVDYLTVNRFQRQPYSRLKKSLSDITFDPITVNQNTLRDRWTVRFTSSTNFTVEGYSTGQQIGTGTIGTTYTTDNGGLSFLVNAGTISPSAGDRWEILTSPYVGNMDPDFDELGKLLADTFTFTIIGGQG